MMELFKDTGYFWFVMFLGATSMFLLAINGVI